MKEHLCNQIGVLSRRSLGPSYRIRQHQFTVFAQFLSEYGAFCSGLLAAVGT